MANDSGAERQPRLRTILGEDLRRGEFFEHMRRDFADLREFYIDDAREKQLAAMHPVKRWLYILGWLLKALFLKLTPARRLLVVAGVIILFASRSIQVSAKNFTISSDTSFVGAFILIFALMLELKDKLIARSELEEGRAVQSALMPERTPQMEGWSVWLFTRTANEVGGDLVDFQRLDGERAAVSIADVAGKGLKAALVTAKVQATLRAIAPDRTSIAALGALLNRIFYRDTMRTMFASLIYLEIVPSSDTVSFLNAGHMPPILLKSSGVKELGKGDPALGIFPETAFAERTTAVGAGEYLILYSDGVTEAKNTTGEFYGTQRLLAALPPLTGMDPAWVGERIVNGVAAFTGEARLHDDLSLVVLRRNPSEPDGAKPKAV